MDYSPREGMMSNKISDKNGRRAFLKMASVAAAVPLVASSEMVSPSSAAVNVEVKYPAFRYCLNTSTIRAAKLGLPRVIEIASQAGYDGIEPWIRDIDQFVKQGGRLQDLRRQLDDCGLQVENAIGFPNWAVEDEAKRKAGFEEAKRGMDLIRQLGGKRIAAPPAGIYGNKEPKIDLFRIAGRYHNLLELGKSMEVIPQLEIWGSSHNLSHISEAIFVATAANHPQAAILPDIYHLFRGGSGFEWIRLMSTEAIQVFHINDYPAEPDREKQNDSHRVYPGDGVAPMKLIFRSLQKIGFRGALSLELFNKEYWKQDPAVVAQTGLEKMKQVVANSLG